MNNSIQRQMIILLVAPTLLLTACGTTFQRSIGIMDDVDYYGLQCEKLGYEPQSDKWRTCTQELIEASLSGERNPDKSGSEDSYRQQRMNDQIMQHGAGGCTPDFATGGCL